jgi:hypothetical protein
VLNEVNIANYGSGVPRMTPFFSIPTKNASTNQRFFSTLLTAFGDQLAQVGLSGKPVGF